LDWIYELPLPVSGTVFVAVFAGGALAGLLLTRRAVDRWFYTGFEDHNEAIGVVVGTYGVLYGITLGLIAVATWENFDKVSDLAEQEAATTAALLRDARALPAPHNRAVAGALARYVDHVIERAWPEHRHGRVPREGVVLTDDIQDAITAFRPKELGEAMLLGEMLDRFNHMVELRRGRLDAVSEGLPGLLWFVVLVGAGLNVGLMYFVRVEPFRTHALMIVMVSSFIGLLLFLVAVLDYPFRGGLSVSPEPFLLIREHLLQTVAPGAGAPP
jgi:hypothetical protein